jgi:hypothetical protein
MYNMTYVYRKNQTQYKRTCSSTLMLVLYGNRTRDLMRYRRVIGPLGQISRQMFVV